MSNHYSIVPVHDKESGKILHYLFRCEDKSNPKFGIPHLYGRGHFIKMQDPEDAITFVNYLNDTADFMSKENVQ